MTLYDVCNDYSLDSNVSDKSRAAAESKAYTWKKHTLPLTFGTAAALYGYHKEYDELHYIKSDNSNLDGVVI